jgi:hypothetical protein
MKKVIAELIVVVDDEIKSSELAANSEGKYILSLNPNEHRALCFENIDAPEAKKSKSIVAHELGHFLGYLCDEPNHLATTKALAMPEWARAKYLPYANYQCTLPRERIAWENAYAITNDIVPGMAGAALKTYEDSPTFKR